MSYYKPPQPQRGLFPTPQWRDLWAAILYYACLGIFIGMAAMNYLSIRRSFGSIFPESSVTLSFDGMQPFVAAAGSGLMTTCMCLSALLFMFRKDAKLMVNLSLFGSMALCIIIGGTAFIARNYIGGVVCSFLVLIIFILFILCRKNIEFTALLIKFSVDVMGNFPAVILVSLSKSVLMIAFTVVVVFADIMVWRTRFEKKTALVVGQHIYNFFFWAWTTYVIKTVGDVTISGVAATVFFVGTEDARRMNPTCASLKRSLTYSFGSICFGSLLMAIILTLKALANTRSRNDNLATAIIRCIAVCILSCLQDILEYINKYAYCHVAIYGKSYIQAGKDTWEMMKRRGIEALTNDNILGFVVFCYSVAIACATVLVECLVLRYCFKEVDLTDYSILVPLMGMSFLLSSIITCFVFDIIDTGVTTMFVCIAEDPVALSRTDPALYNEIVHKYQDIVFS